MQVINSMRSAIQYILKELHHHTDNYSTVLQYSILHADQVLATNAGYKIRYLLNDELQSIRHVRGTVHQSLAISDLISA